MNINIPPEAIDKLKMAARLKDNALTVQGQEDAKDAALRAIDMIDTCPHCGALEGHLHDMDCASLDREPEGGTAEDMYPRKVKVQAEDLKPSDLVSSWPKTHFSPTPEETKNRFAREVLKHLNIGADDPAAHYKRAVLRVAIRDADISRGYVEVSLDPYRVAQVHDMRGGPREQILKKCLRFTSKGDSEDKVIADIRSALDRWEEMREEDRRVPCST